MPLESWSTNPSGWTYRHPNPPTGTTKFKHVSQFLFIQSLSMWNRTANSAVHTPAFKTELGADILTSIEIFIQQFTIHSTFYSLLYCKQDQLDPICLSGPFPRRKPCQAGHCLRYLWCVDRRGQKSQWDKEMHRKWLSKQSTGKTSWGHHNSISSKDR